MRHDGPKPDARRLSASGSHLNYRRSGSRSNNGEYNTHNQYYYKHRSNDP
jgi:hypothetical protein